MAGYDTVRLVHRLEEEVAELGFQMCYSRPERGDGDLVAVKPTDNGVPIYHRDVELFTGTLAKEFGDELCTLSSTCAYDIAEAGIKALQDEANMLYLNPAVKKAYEQFVLICQLTKESK